jgi:hypothetical protein
MTRGESTRRAGARSTPFPDDREIDEVAGTLFGVASATPLAV